MFTDPQLWLSLLTLTLLEVVLGIDNLLFLTIISNRLPQKQQKSARRIGLILALGMRLLFLAGIVWLMGLSKPLFTLFNQGFSIRDIILIAGGIFLLYKSTSEIHITLEIEEEQHHRKKNTIGFFLAIIQIIIFDLIFSIDSILTAIGLSQQFWVMAMAIGIAILAMLLASEPLSRFIKNFPTFKMLALSFLLLIGVILIADGFGVHIPRGYLYFAIVFSLLVESLNTFARQRIKKHRIKKQLLKKMSNS